MSERASSQPSMTPRTVADKAARTDRLASEMRKNLLKRKRQQREMTSSSESGCAREGEPEDRR